MFFLKYLVAILNKVEYFSTFFVACFWLWVSLHAVVWNWQFGGAVLLYVSPSAETSLNFSLSLDWGYGFDIKLKQDFITLNRGYTIKMIYHFRCWPWFVAESVSVRFLHCEALFSPQHTVLFEKTTGHMIYLWDVWRYNQLPQWWTSCINNFEFCLKKLSLLHS